MRKIIATCLICLLFTGGISYSYDKGYRVYKSLVSDEQGDIFVTVPMSNCSDTIECEGVHRLVVDKKEEFQLCWDTDEQYYCETSSLRVSAIGKHYFKIYAFAGEEETLPSTEVILIVKRPPSSGGCSVRKFI